LVDTKYKDIQSLKIGYSDTESEEITALIGHGDKQVAPDRDQVKPFAAINDKSVPDVTHHHRYWLVETVMDGFNREAIFTQDVVSVGVGKALQQGADNDLIGHLVAKLSKIVTGTATVTYEAAHSVLSGLHISVSNRKGRKYQPTTIHFKCIGTRLET